MEVVKDSITHRCESPVLLSKHCNQPSPFIPSYATMKLKSDGVDNHLDSANYILK